MDADLSIIPSGKEATSAVASSSAEVSTTPVGKDAPSTAGASSSASSSSKKKIPLRFKLKKWDAVALWSWDTAKDLCLICHRDLLDVCGAECLPARGEDAPIECCVAWGACNHAFHRHCIERWHKNPVCNQKYPLDSSKWVIQKIGPKME